MKALPKQVLISLAACVAILVLGVAGKAVLASFKKPPAQAEAPERVLTVDAVRATLEDVPISITGYGEVRALNSVAITPEVSGRVVEIHPNLEVGEVIPKGDTLFVIDPRTYQARLDEAKAAVSQAKTAVERLQTQASTDKERLKTLERTRDLARAEYQRLQKLMKEDDVGTQSGVDAAEQAMNAAEDAYDRLKQSIELYPLQIEEARSALARAEASVQTAAIDLGRTRLSAPFDARVKSVNLEKGQYVGPGASGFGGSPVITLADDSVLEISVPLDSRDARRWLLFSGDSSADNVAWFSTLQPAACSIRWTEDPHAHRWEGVLNRVEKFDSETRTLTVAIRVEGANALSKDEAALPLVEGMFCSVSIPGRVLKNACALPVAAVSFEKTAYLAVDGRLHTADVEVSHTDGDTVYVTGGLKDGDIVVTTRLSNPLENTLLDVRMEDPSKGGALASARQPGEQAP